MAFDGSAWYSMILQAITWYPMVLNGLRWNCMVFDVIASCYMVFIGIQRYCMTGWHHKLWQAGSGLWGFFNLSVGSTNFYWLSFDFYWVSVAMFNVYALCDSRIFKKLIIEDSVSQKKTSLVFFLRAIKGRLLVSSSNWICFCICQYLPNSNKTSAMKQWPNCTGFT